MIRRVAFPPHPGPLPQGGEGERRERSLAGALSEGGEGKRGVATLAGAPCLSLTGFLHDPDKWQPRMKYGVGMKINEGTRSCLIHDQTFIQCGANWVHPAVERMPNAQRIRVRFDSREYFELIIKHPRVIPYLQGVRNLQLPVEDRVYEIYE